MNAQTISQNAPISGATFLNQPRQERQKIKGQDYFDQIVSVEFVNGKLQANYFKQPVSAPIYPTLSNQSIKSTHNVVLPIEEEMLVLTRVTEENEQGICANIPLFFKTNNYIKVPSKVQRAVERYVPKSMLRAVNQDIDVAVDLCMIFLSNLSDTYFLINGIGSYSTAVEKEGWKNLNSEILRKQFHDQPNTYKRIIECLIYGTSKGAIIECDGIYGQGYKSYAYRLTDGYRAKGIVSYQFQSDYAKNLYKQGVYNRVIEVSNNSICKNLINLYVSMRLPTISEIEEEANRLIVLKYTTKKGKLLTRMGKKTKSYWKHPEERSFIEESIEIYKYLTEDGLMVPTPGNDKSGGRIVDSFTLMPSWIRSLIKINGQPIVEVDYSALHPNIAMYEYEGRKEFLTHQQVAEESGIDIKEVKIEHLSFFNKRWFDMQKSKLFEYYDKTEPLMLFNLRVEKDQSQFGHKATCRTLFKKEVEIMTDVIEQLNNIGINVGSVYDALFCEPKDREIVRDVMNEVILLHGVKSIAK